MAKNITKSVTVGTSAVNVATALGLAANVACTEMVLQNHDTNSGDIYFGESSVSTINGLKLVADYTERAAGNEPIQLGDIFIIATAAAQRVNIHVRV